jgi:hypothetical protein
MMRCIPPCALAVAFSSPNFELPHALRAANAHRVQAFLHYDGAVFAGTDAKM